MGLLRGAGTVEVVAYAPAVGACTTGRTASAGELRAASTCMRRTIPARCIGACAVCPCLTPVMGGVEELARGAPAGTRAVRESFRGRFRGTLRRERMGEQSNTHGVRWLEPCVIPAMMRRSAAEQSCCDNHKGPLFLPVRSPSVESSLVVVNRSFDFSAS